MKKARFLSIIASKMQQYPLRSQESEEPPIFVVKLFNAFWPGTWFLTEYDPETHDAFGYVTGLMEDEWGYISVDELSNLQFHGAPAIEIDRYFEPTSATVVIGGA